MRIWASLVIVVVAMTPAAADPLGYAAMPGGLRAPGADTLPGGTFALAGLGGYGFRNTLLSEDHKLSRGIGDLAFAYAPADSVTLAVSFDGRYDKHTGFAAEDEEGIVGDPHALVRLGKTYGSVRAGAQLGIWLPGKDAPSVAPSATSIEARGLLGFTAGTARVSISAGFRIDNSAESVDDPAVLSPEDRVSLGVSDFHAAVGGVHVVVPLGKAFVGFEASADMFVGSGAPGPIVRGGALAGVALNPTWSAFAFVQAATVPALDPADVMAGDITLIPYEPLVTGGVGISAQFGGRAKPVPLGTGTIVKTTPPPPPGPVIEYAELSGTVVDDAGNPVAGATVTVELADGTVTTATTDATGRFAFSKLAIGKTTHGTTALDNAGAEVTVTLDGKQPKTTKLALVKGGNQIAGIALDPIVTLRTLRALIRAAATGKPIANATVKIEPGGHVTTADADGNIAIDLPAGTYKATASHAGFRDQTLEVVIGDGTVVKNFELRK